MAIRKSKEMNALLGDPSKIQVGEVTSCSLTPGLADYILSWGWNWFTIKQVLSPSWRPQEATLGRLGACFGREGFDRRRNYLVSKPPDADHL